MSYILKIYVDATSGIITCDYPIPPQKLTLKSYRIQFDSDANAKAAEVITFNTPWLKNVTAARNDASTSTHAMLGYPLFLGITQIEVRDCNYSVELNKPIPRNYTYSIQGNNLTGFLNLQLIFQYDIK